jgi:YOP proteins translocation protein K (YscK)
VFEKRIDQLMFDFNLRPAAYIDPSWVPERLRPTWQRVSQNGGESGTYASQWALEYFELKGHIDFDFTGAEKRLLLLDAASLKEVILALGLASMKTDLQRWVGKAEQQALKRQLGESMFAFLFEAIVPARHVVRIPTEGLKARDSFLLALSNGLTLLLSCVGEEGGASARRASLKLPQAHVARSRIVSLTEARRQRIVEFCIDCVVRKRLHQWHWLF